MASNESSLHVSQQTASIIVQSMLKREASVKKKELIRNCLQTNAILLSNKASTYPQVRF